MHTNTKTDKSVLGDIVDKLLKLYGKPSFNHVSNSTSPGNFQMMFGMPNDYRQGDVLVDIMELFDDVRISSLEKGIYYLCHNDSVYMLAISESFKGRPSFKPSKYRIGAVPKNKKSTFSVWMYHERGYHPIHVKDAPKPLELLRN